MASVLQWWIAVKLPVENKYFEWETTAKAPSGFQGQKEGLIQAIFFDKSQNW